MLVLPRRFYGSMNPIETRELGRTGIKLTQFGFGAARLGELFAMVSEEDSLATLQAAWNNGVRYFDTAPWYGLGLSEHRVGSFSLSTTAPGVCPLHEGGTRPQSP